MPTSSPTRDALRLVIEAGGISGMREHISPLLPGGTERSLGGVIASAPA